MQTVWLQNVFYYEGKELCAKIGDTVENDVQTDPIDIRDELSETS